MRHFFRTLLVSGLVATSGCIAILFYDDSCGPEYRLTTVRGDIRDGAGTRIGMVSLELQEVRADTLERAMGVLMLGVAQSDPGPLSGKVSDVRLVTTDGTVLRDFAFGAGTPDEIVRIPGEALTQAELDELKQLAIAGRLQLELETTLAGNERIVVPLPLQHAGVWNRAHCS